MIALATKRNPATPRCLQLANKERLGGATSAGLPWSPAREQGPQLLLLFSLEPKQQCARDLNQLARWPVVREDAAVSSMIRSLARFSRIAL
jgi:hypothetical protein